jgi:hypothetical protein
MMTVNEVWLALVLVVSHIVQLVLVLKPSCANVMKTGFNTFGEEQGRLTCVDCGEKRESHAMGLSKLKTPSYKVFTFMRETS